MTSARKKLMEYAKLKSTVVHDGFVNHVEQDHVISVVSGLMFALRMEKRNQNGSNSNQMTNTQRMRSPRLEDLRKATSARSVKVLADLCKILMVIVPTVKALERSHPRNCARIVIVVQYERPMMDQENH